MFRIVLLLFAILACACSARVEYEQPPKPGSTGAVNINNASVEELQNLPHIGRKTAEAIVQFREENGPFRRVENILLIRGVSEKHFAEIRGSLRTE